MKTFSNLVKNTVMILAAVLLSGMMTTSCKKAIQDPQNPGHKLKETCVESVYTLWAGQNIDAGVLSVLNDATNVYITYHITNADPSLALNEIHLWAGLDPDQCPQNTPGFPKIGQFPYYANASSSTPQGNPLLTDPLEYTVTIPLATLGAACGNVIYIAAHGKASVETMWSEGEMFVPGSGSWATYSAYTVCCGGGDK